ncbi:hypothetical protein [Streptomyces sp. DSM 15324]|uniref:hypothetical protein n=1 Tax=Streptomyces sp. DSM 15324 TaxID=1739111 RepID=UPI000747B5EC|nr:hypothetical protein [Streptomyces sp. DSM 15324]KUO10218.1 hypothetical protein AQJ58_19740 [Streptomyces sp. DSM 15324]
MPTAVLTDRERTAVQAYLRLLHTVRAAFGEDFGGEDFGGAGSRAFGPPPVRLPPVVPPAVLAEAERALAEAGLAGNEQEFFRLLRSWCPAP